MSTIDALNSIYRNENIQKLGDLEIYRCVKKFDGDNVYEIHYIDFTDRWLEPELDKYYQSILNRDFYGQEGYLQWNFYYYFISSQANVSENKYLIRSIEIDETFARKRVLDITAFLKLSDSLNDIGHPTQNGIERDLYSIWVDELKKEQLHFVYEDNVRNFKRSVDDYINGKTVPVREAEGFPQSSAQVPTLNQIKELRLLNYRKHPDQKTFKLGQVVLGFGANATGKTSFLDAIELIVTGKCNRQGDTSTYKLELTDDLERVYQFPDNTNPYKNRDSGWYNNYATRGNNLNGNFNRFNYFTSDAAYDLKKQDGDSEYNLEKIIGDIALGHEVNKLEEKIRGFLKRFDEENNSALKDLKALNDEIRTRENEILAIQRQNTQPKELKEKLLLELRTRSWILSASDEDEGSFLQSTDKQIHIVEDCLNKINKPLNSVLVITRANVNDKLREIKELVKEIADHKEFLHSLKVGLREKQLRQDSVTERYQVLAKLEKYYLHPNIDGLVGLSKRIADLELVIKNKKAIYEIFTELPITDQFLNDYREFVVSEIGSQISRRRSHHSALQSDNQHRITELENGIDRLNRILTDLRSSGVEYLQADPNAEACPLCGTKFQKDHLAVAIEQTKTHFASASVLQELKNQRELYRNQIFFIEIDSNIVDGLKDIILLDSEYGDFKLGHLFHTLQAIQTEIELKVTEKFDLESIQSSFLVAGLNEADFLKYISLWEPNKVQPPSISEFNAARLELISKVESEKSVVDKTREAITDAELKLQQFYTAELENDKVLSDEKFALEECAENFKTLSLYVVQNDNRPLNEYIHDLLLVKATFSQYQHAWEQNQLAFHTETTLKQSITINLAKIELVKPRQQRAQKAAFALQHLLDNYNKNKYLTNYINTNRKEIVDIFTLIHSPKEFKDIEIEDSKIYLISSEDRRSLDQISTGQRGALALSIFLSLNKKLQHGPNLILLDDPIAYVDDLNVLSFLDYLRALVINSKKQVIFVTANSDLAFLFKMKFEFLNGSAFTIFKFDRNEVN